MVSDSKNMSKGRSEKDGEIRVQFYHMDGGLYRKSWIQHISKKEFSGLCHNERGAKAICIKEDDWYGKNCLIF